MSRNLMSDNNLDDYVFVQPMILHWQKTHAIPSLVERNNNLLLGSKEIDRHGNSMDLRLEEDLFSHVSPELSGTIGPSI